MEYVIINSTAAVSKIKVEYKCPRCGTQLKNPIEEAGTRDQCPECGGEFEVPGKSELEKFTQRELEATMKTASINLIKEKVAADAAKKKAKSRAASDQLRALSNKRTSANMKWTDRVNLWLAKTVAELNGLLFIMICLSGVVIGVVLLVQADREQFFFTGSISTLIILGSILLGIMLCGFTAIMCSMHKSLGQMSNKD